MLTYFLIGLSLVLIGVVGLQFSYLFYIDRIFRERKSYLRNLEQRFARASKGLAEAERRLAEQNELMAAAYPGWNKGEEVWADVIEDR